MKRAWIDRLATPGGGASLELDPVRVADDELIEAFLVSSDTREVWPLVAGVAVLPADLDAHMRTQGNVYRRTPINDPRLARFLLGQAGSGYTVVPFEEVVSQYRDLVAEPPAGYDTTPAQDHVDLGAFATELELSGTGCVIGAGVGREVFRLCERLDAVLGFDRNIACVRRARNIAVTVEDFFLPAPKGSGLKELPLDFGNLTRAGADFAVAHPTALPLADASMDVVVLRGADSLGPFDEPGVALREATRVLAPGGRLICHRDALPSHTPAQAVGDWSVIESVSS